MKKVYLIVVLSLMTVVAACGGGAKANQEELEKADQAVYDFIVATIEGNHDKLKEVLTDDAQSILEEGRHANPGYEEKMGEKYEIKRYEGHFDDDKLYYYIKFYTPSLEDFYHMNLLMVKDADGNWKSTELNGIERDEMREAMGNEEPTLVHETKGDEGDE